MSLLNYEFIKYRPSLAAGTAVYLALQTFAVKFDKEELFFFARMNEEQLLPCLKDLVGILMVNPLKKKRRNLRRKYKRVLDLESLEKIDYKF